MVSSVQYLSNYKNILILFLLRHKEKHVDINPSFQNIMREELNISFSNFIIFKTGMSIQ